MGRPRRRLDSAATAMAPRRLPQGLAKLQDNFSQAFGLQVDRSESIHLHPNQLVAVFRAAGSAFGSAKFWYASEPCHQDLDTAKKWWKALFPVLVRSPREGVEPYSDDLTGVAAIVDGRPGPGGTSCGLVSPVFLRRFRQISLPPATVGRTPRKAPVRSAAPWPRSLR